MKTSILTVRVSDLLRDSLKYMKIKCGINDNSMEGEQIYQKCMRMWSEFFFGGQISFLVGSFGRECLDESHQKLVFGGREYTCHLLEQMDLSAVTGGFLYLFHAPEVDITGMSQEECFLIDGWQIALLDGARIWLERYLRRQQPEARYLSGSFGPGFYGMELEAVAAMVEGLDGQRIGIRLASDGLMEPAKSLVGMFLTGRKPFAMPEGDCVSCQGVTNCRMCRHYTGKEEKG